MTSGAPNCSESGAADTASRDELTRDCRDRAGRVRLILLDADGVLTDGRLFYSARGEELKVFDVRDGLGIRLAQRAGLEFAIISGRQSPALATRAAELSIDEVHMRIHDKVACARTLLEHRGLEAESVCFIGDDLIDVPLLRLVGFAIAPADAVPEARAAAHWVTRRPGGRGAVREAIDLLLHASDRWATVTRSYLA